MWTIDTNVLVYAFDERFPAKRLAAVAVVGACHVAGAPLGLQVLGEAYRVLTKRLHGPPEVISGILARFAMDHPCFSVTRSSFLTAMEHTASRRLAIWDANLVAAADAAGCTHLLSEDMQDSQRFGRLEIVNPFSGDGLSPRVRDLLQL
ncbi:PIN domain-containing protein [Chthonobacter albigriseus]|uniref:PIN domain-containing protein n=1 Tax=Chthonobacter albigriseus TaxID=1683161 RepID=UPI0015EF507C|nr:PIN domain-containing protein [Chthonobacter albigriseus]